MQSGPLIQQAVAMDPTAGLVVDAADALRGALYGIGFPAKSMRTPEDIETIRAAQAARAQQEQMLATLGGAAAAAKDMAAAESGPAQR